MNDLDPTVRPANRWSKLLVLATCAMLVAWVAQSARTTLDERRALSERLAAAGVPEDGRRQVMRESTPHHARLHAARALVYNALVRLRQDDGSERRLAVEALPEARRLASSALSEQPNSWQSAMLYGTALYLERSVAQDRRLITEASDWERPLDNAVRDAPGQPEPRRLLATAYLETWPNLSPAKRRRAKDLMRDVFADDARAFAALAPAWLGLGLDRDEAFSVVPDDPAAWQVFETAYTGARRFGDAAVARDRRLDALERQLDAERQEAEARLALGDFFRARSMLLRVVLKSPPSRRFAPLVEQALDAYPPGLHGLSSPERLRGWIEWAIELDRVQVEGLRPLAIGRLLDAVGEIEPPVAAHAALLAEDRYQAERFERLAQPLTLAVWAPYLVSKARRWAIDGDHDGAREALGQVALGARGDLPYRLASAEVTRVTADLATATAAASEVDALRAGRWDALDWRRRRGRPVLDLLPATAASGLAIRLELAGPGAVVEVDLDGHALGTRAVYPGQVLRFDIEIDTAPHLLAVRTVAGHEATPTETWLLGVGARR